MRVDTQHGVDVLSNQDLQSIEGGTVAEIWYAVGYYFGRGVHMAEIIGSGVNEGSWAAWHA